MYADAVIAAILQADLLETPIKNTSTNAKIDRMHFKVQPPVVLLLSRKNHHFNFIVWVNHILYSRNV